MVNSQLCLFYATETFASYLLAFLEGKTEMLTAPSDDFPTEPIFYPNYATYLNSRVEVIP